MRKSFVKALWVTTAAGALVTGITIASAQGPGGDHGGHGRMGGGHPGNMAGPAMGGRGMGSAQIHQGAPSRGPMAGPAMGNRGMGSAQIHQGAPSRGFVGGNHAQSWGVRPSRPQLGAMQQHGRALGEQHQGRAAFGENRIGEGRGLGPRTGEFREHQRQGFAGAEHGRDFREYRGAGAVKHGQGYAYAPSGRGHFALSDVQRSRVHDVFVRHGFISRYRVSDVDFDVDVGVRIPQWFHTFWVPEDIVLIAPEFEGYRCFVYEDEIVIVDPYTLEIVAVIPV
jgi:hypothetical protein